MTTLFTWLAISSCVLARPEAFDYVIVGGGTCGLVVANRLSQAPNVSVAIIEVGGDQRHNPNVTDPSVFPAGLNTAIDWQYESVNQTNGGNRPIAYHAGKAIGGTSTINGMTYVRGQKVQLDAWETIGNRGWNWDTLYHYYKQLEHYDPPTQAQLAAGASYQAQYHGFSGDIHVGYPFELLNGSFHSKAQQGWAALGQPLNPDPNSGDVHGFGVWPYTANRDKNLRDDAATVFYWPVANRPNLKLFRGTANRIVWASGKEATASGVEYINTSGEKTTLQAKKEVIVSAGTLRSAPFLEMSGVGNPKVLSGHGIKTKINLPGVGENLIDQPNIILGYASNISYNGLAPYSTFATAADYLGTKKAAALSTSVESSIAEWAEQVVANGNNYTSASSVETLFKVQHDLIFNKAVPNVEIITTALGTALVSAWIPLLPFSRGSIHMGSDPDQPMINTRFFEFDFDLETTVSIGKWVRSLWETAAIKPLAGKNIIPGTTVLPKNATDAQWRKFVQDDFGSNSHPIGTAAMMPKDMGGVVDTELKVYGTTNVRVIDASVIPMQISGHLTATLYAIAQRASDFIMAGH